MHATVALILTYHLWIALVVFCFHLFSSKLFYSSSSGYTETLDENTEIVVPEDDYGLYAIDILDPSMVSNELTVPLLRV